MKYLETSRRITKEGRAALKARRLYAYARRDNGRESTIEPSVAVDFIGSLITDFPIDFPKEGPSAYVIYDGDAYLKAIGARRVYSIAEF